MNYFLSLHSFYVMSTDYFTFKRFVVHQQRCAMKVGTDGCLLGAWAHGGHQILDVGTGTGLIALMMAQRFPEAHVRAVDIDAGAVAQAAENVSVSPFYDRVDVEMSDFLTMDGKECYDAIVSNPPFFVDALPCPDKQRLLARHAVSLPYDGLVSQAQRLLTDEGEFSVIVPTENKQLMESAAALSGFVLARSCAVKTTVLKQPRRYLLAFSKHLPDEFESSELVIGSADYVLLMHDFYLKM